MEITTELNGEKYLIVEILATKKSDQNKLEAKLKKHKAIYQGVKELSAGGFWTNPYVIFKVLVPEKNVVAFNDDDSY